MNNATYKLLRNLSQSRHNQRKSPYFVAEGLRCATEAIQRKAEWIAGAVISSQVAPDIRERFETALAAAGLYADYMDGGEFASIAQTEGSQGVLCLLKKPTALPAPRLCRPCNIILDQVREPGNFGTILRTAWALGIDQVWTTSGSADAWSPKVVRSGMGAQFAIDVIQFPDLPAAADCFRELGGGEVWCAMMDGEASLFSPAFTPVGGLIVMGNEGHGITHPEVGRGVSIPMPGAAESLNVAQAATLLLYEALRRNHA